MSERAQYIPGTFSWVDLTTTDQEAAKRFYSALFGWEATDLPIGNGAFYSMMKLGGKDVAAISPQPQQQREAGVSPTWNSYITVRNADETLQCVSALGGSVHSPAFDVMDAGRMAVAQDPHGVFFLLWEPKEHIGAQLVNAPGAFSWNELASPDFEASKHFYSELFGWTTEPFEGTGQPYFVIKNGETGNGGMRSPQPDEPPNWSVYFGVEELDQGLEKVSALGGKVLAGPIDIGVGKIGVVQDPQGAVFVLYAGVFGP
ncbi:MAG: VOC family protein [Candidatus Dormibacteraceae bacterium]